MSIQVEEEKVVIDQDTFNKNDLNKIAARILNRCNYFHKKHVNNDTELKAGEGKTMITNGMSVRDFVKKYHLK